jgi:hypothetical protein
MKNVSIESSGGKKNIYICFCIEENCVFTEKIPIIIIIIITVTVEM